MCPPNMVAEARRLNPGLDFREGDMLALLWGVPLTMDFFLHPPAGICHGLEAAGFAVEEVAEREPYPDVEYPSRRAYIFARKRS